MTSRRSFLTVAILSATALAGLGGAGWIWMHRQANTELTMELDQIRSQLPPGTELTWGRAVAMPVSHGARLTDVTLKKPDGTITAAALELVGAHQKPASVDNPGSQLLQFDHVLAHTMRIIVEKGVIDIRRLALDGLTLPTESNRLPELVIDHGELAGLTLHSADGKVSLTLDNAALDQFGTGRASRLVLGHFAANHDVHPLLTLSVERFSSDGDDLASEFIAYLNGQHVPPRDGTQSTHIENLLAKGEAGQPGKVMQPIVGIERLTSFSNTTDQKSHVAVSLTHFRLWPTAPRTAILKTLGYARLDASVVINAMMDYSAGVTHISQFDMNAPTFGRFDLSGDFINVNGSTADALTGRMTPPDVSHLDLSWRDDGLVSHFLQNAALGQGMDPDAYVPLLQRSLAPQGSAPDSIGAQLANYIASPGAGPLTAIVAPQQQLPFGAVVAALATATRPGTADAIGLTIQAASAAKATPDNAPDPDMTTDEPVDPNILKTPPPGKLPPVTEPAGTAPVTPPAVPAPTAPRP
ncbi:3-demethylubiquinone-9 3-methyltransferase [Acetobacter oeni]|uniref:Uncharacterized protein n=1 Tax=Acetobacter oeni TaxID=304077 RepID=A0A511XJT3_9PROT|nr:3-demethylubiquinone-9 3-methyltransferase [Acetobacter oeni]MBB3883434.1 hypothetical protein [Acetobacter oeni]NHO19406.1 3-demethylubiquinone-9 3-methyltransferase [Acetobacter oeni]GBR04014.1 hypothetical protein AA21952_1264 [Acetobacter oeni LMG 21952]GEN63215.1 hypothetical protein AOE01nite_14390 [Acetobacter oeni]